jgi:DNA processing protein
VTSHSNDENLEATVSITDKDDIAALLDAGREHRDAWLPLRGTRDSGFTYPGGTADLPAESITSTPEQSQPVETLGEIQALLSDPTIRVLRWSSPDYPTRLRELDGRPALLFVKGNLTEPSATPLAIVGSRRASSTGLRVAHELARSAAEAGHIVISGLAAGIDSASHQGALDGGGQTIAVMGTGLGNVFPKENRMLAERISQHGALVTQFPPTHPATKTTFPARNVLIAGLSDVTILVEMNEYSGTRIEADSALAQGKRVLLWAPTLGNFEWARRFAEREQVAFVETPDDVLSELSAVK